MTEPEQPALEKIITPNGDLNKPIPPELVFGTLCSEEKFKKTNGCSKRPYPPIPADNSGYVFDPNDDTLKTTIWGKASFSNDGIIILPLWTISEDKMFVVVEVDSEDFAGKAITAKRLLECMPHDLESVDLKLNIEAIDIALHQAAKTKQTVLATVLQGTPPVQGKDASLKLSFNKDQTAGTLRKDGSMDFRERASLHTVTENDLLGELLPPVPGTMGHDIFGNSIKPMEPRKVNINLGQGVSGATKENGSTIYTATRPGVARFRNGTLEVTDLLKIEGDIDFKTGNIRAQHGSIHITGDVKCGFSVESSNDIIIDGVVEEANITAGGLVVAGGVIMDGRNKIEAKESVSAHFFRNANVIAGGDVNAEVEISHCKITANGQVTILGNKGTISGGHIISSNGIHANIIGNKACTDTCVEIRTNTPKIKTLEASRKQLEDELDNLSKAIGEGDVLNSLMNSPDEDRRILAELIKVRSAIQTDVRSLDDSIKAMHKEAQKQLISKHIKAEQKVFCGTTIIIGGKTLKPTADMEAPRYYLDLDSQQISFD